MTELAVSLSAVHVERGGRCVLGPLSWTVEPGQRWVILGPNGSGKTTLIRLVGGHIFPTAGEVEVLGHTFGKVDMRALRTQIGFVSCALIRNLRPELTAREAVASGLHAALETWWHDYTEADFARADELLAAGRVPPTQTVGVLSEGERQQMLLARALMGNPDLLLLDEPFAGLDFGARERLLARLSGLTTDPTAPPLVLVTHHVEEIPPGITHALLLCDAQVVAAGPLEDTLTAPLLSRTFGLDVQVGRDNDRWWSRATI